MAYSANDMKILTGFKIDETALQQGVREAIGNVEKISEVRIPITINGKEGVQVLRQYMDELNNTISSSQNFMKGANNQFMAGNEKITSFAEATNKAKSGLDALNNKIKSIDASFDAQTKSGEMVISNLKEYTKAMAVGNKTEKQFSYQGQVLTETTQEYYDSVNKATRYIKTFTDAQGNSVSVLDKTTKKVSTLGIGFSNMIGTMMKVAQFQIMTKFLNLMQSGITGTISAVWELDDALTEFKKVSDLSGEALDEYTQKLADLGELSARTVQEMVEASTVFKQAGFTDEDSASLAQMATVLQNISDEEISASDAGGFLISQMKAFSGQLSDIEGVGNKALYIMDALNEVSNRYEVSSSDLEDGLKGIASTASSAGASFEETISMLTAITEVTRNANTASRGLRQIFTRLTQTLDESSSTGKKLINIYSELGIELKDSAGQMRDPYEILKELSEKWGDLDNNTRQYIALTSSGANQVEKFNALMNNFSTAVDANSTALNASGSAMEENSKYCESLTAKFNKLKAQFIELATGDGVLKQLIGLLLDAGTAILKFANSDVGKAIIYITTMTVVVKGLATAFNSFSLAGFIGQFESLAFIPPLLELIKAEGLSALTTLTMAESATLILPAIALALMGIYKAYQYVSEAQERVIENAKESYSKWEEEENKVKKLQDQLSAVEDKIASINAQTVITITDENQLKLLSGEKEQLEQQLEIQEKLAKIAKAQATQDIYSALNSDGTYEEITSDKERNSGFFGHGVNKTGNIFEETNSNVESYQYETQQLAKLQEEYDGLLAKKEENGKLSVTERDRLTALTTSIAYTKDQIKYYGDEVQGNSSQIMEWYNSLSNLGVAFDEMPQELQDGINSLDGFSYAMTDSAKAITDENSLLEGLADAIDEPIDSIDDFAEKAGLSESALNDIREAMDEGNYVKAYSLACAGATEDLSGLADEEDELAESTEDSISALEEQLSAITSLYDSYGTLQQAVADFNTNGYIDPSNLKELLSLGDEYLSLLQMQDGQLSINEAGFEALANAQYDKAEADAYEEYTQKMTALAQAEAKGTLDELQTATNSYSTEPMNAQLQNLVQNLGLAIDGFNKLAVASANVNIKTSKGKDIAKQYSSSLQTQLTFIEAGRKGIGKHTASIKSNTKATGSNTSSRKSNTGSTKSNTDAQKANTEALKKNVDALKKQKEAIEKEKEDMEKVISYIEDKVNDYIDELEDAKDAETDLIDDALDGLDDIKDALDDAFDEDKIDKLNKIMDESVKKLDELNDELQKLRSEGKNTTGVEKEIEALNKSLEIQKQIIQYKQNAENAKKEEERIENEINRLKEENDELEQQLEYKELLDNLAKAQQTRLKVYKEGQGFVYTEDQSAISEAQKALDEWLRKKKLDDQIKQLEDQRDRQKKIYDQQLENLDNLKDDCDELYDQMNKDLEEYKNQVKKRWDDQINYYKNWLAEFKKGVDAYDTEQNRLLALEKTGIDFEQQGWQTRLSNLNSFVESYKAKLAELEEATRRLNEAQQAYEQAQAQASASGASSGGGGGGGSSSGGGGGYTPTPASTPTPAPSKVTPLKGRVYSYNSGLNYRFIEGNDRSPKVTTTAWQHGFKVQKVFANGSAYVLTKSGKLALVQASEWNSDKVRKTAGTKAYASGASSISDDQMALVGDSPTNNELVIGSKLNGQFMNLKKGSGVVNATSTNTLAGLLNQLPKLTGHSINATTNNNTSSNDTVFSIGNITIDGANITDITSFKNALINIKSEAIQRAYQH